MQLNVCAPIRSQAPYQCRLFESSTARWWCRRGQQTPSRTAIRRSHAHGRVHPAVLVARWASLVYPTSLMWAQPGPTTATFNQQCHCCARPLMTTERSTAQCAFVWLSTTCNTGYVRLRRAPMSYGYWSQGDVLSGTLAAFKSWAVNNPESAEDAARKLGLRPDLLTCWGACATVRQVCDTTSSWHEAHAARDRHLAVPISWQCQALGAWLVQAGWVMRSRIV